ncbi:hypothetical protein PoB_004375400 [Plakobranchus ocellatus]|uniref:Uncharacterized protein n=1 Tax=Plakobranchus ocellatus TaxID=259542 RepID=A0AAV4BFX4_9GAST|nr:hypothetical protein PoB_004375400 [Plakobranchus ocellatus]
MLNKLPQYITNIFKKNPEIDVVEYIQRHKRMWAGHIAREKDTRWTKRCASGNQGHEEETGADRKQDGWMTSGNQYAQNERGRHKIGGSGIYLQRSTSCS